MRSFIHRQAARKYVAGGRLVGDRPNRRHRHAEASAWPRSDRAGLPFASDRRNLSGEGPNRSDARATTPMKNSMTIDPSPVQNWVTALVLVVILATTVWLGVDASHR